MSYYGVVQFGSAWGEYAQGNSDAMDHVLVPVGRPDVDGVDLKKFAKKHNAKLAVVFVSSDNSEGEMRGYMKEAGMPWPSTPFRSASGKKLGETHGVRGIPTLLVFGKDGQLVTKNGRNLAELEKLLAK